MLTSGTIGDAKAVGLTEKALADRIARHSYVFGELLPQCRRTFCDMGYATSLGFQFLIYTALFTLVGIAGEDDFDAPDLIGPGQATPDRDRRSPTRSNGRLDGKSSNLAAALRWRGRKNLRSTKRTIQGQSSSMRSVSTSQPQPQLRDVMLAELNAIGSEDEATKWAHRRFSEKNKLNAADAKHVEEAFRVKVLGFVIHHSEGIPNKETSSSGTTEGRDRKGKATPRSSSVDKSMLMHPEPRRIRDREHVRFVAQQACLVCGRQPCDAHHLRFAQNSALGRKVSDEFTVPLCRVHHRELHRQGDETAWWQKIGLDPTTAARSLWLQTHPLGANKLAVVASDSSGRSRPTPDGVG